VTIKAIISGGQNTLKLFSRIIYKQMIKKEKSKPSRYIIVNTWENTYESIKTIQYQQVYYTR